MIEGTGSTQLDTRLARAQELMARGKQRQALDQLWAAEAVARGDADSLRRMSDVAVVFQQPFEPGQAPRLAQLVEVLQHDIEAASRTPGSPSVVASHPSMSTATKVGAALGLAFSGGLAGAIIGAIIGRATENPNEFLANLDPIAGAIVGFPIGAVVGLLVGVIWVSSR